MTELEFPPGATPLDPDESEGLIPDHITTRGELDRWEQENIVLALDWLDRSNPSEILSDQFIKKLHEKMFGEVWKWAGRYRRSDKNIGGPWFNIQPNVVALCADAELWIAQGDDSPVELGARFHHRLVSIHPFPNGNGRHARLMTDLLLERRLKSERFTWGSGDLSQPSEVRRKYIGALQAADKHDLDPLMAFVVS